MKRIATLAALLAIASLAGVAQAQPRFDHGHSNYPHHNWRQGGHIAKSDWGRGSRIDYRSHHLRRPPRGYEWRQVDGNYVLAAVATGLIASVILAGH